MLAQMPKLLPLKSITLHPFDGEPIEVRRAGAIPDLFLSNKGHIYHLSQVNAHLQGRALAIKYRKTTLMVKHLVADAWIPGWDDGVDGDVHLNLLDGNQENLAVENLSVTTMPQRGRPRDSKLYLRLKAAAIYASCQDVALIAEELGLTQREVLAAVKAFG